MKMRRAVFASTEEEGRDLFARAPTVHVATTDENGTPILRAIHGVLDGDRLAFHGAPAGEKMTGLGRRAVVAAHEVIAEIPSWFLDPERACPATTYYVSAQIDGILEEVVDIEDKAALLERLMNEYQPEGRHVPIRADEPLYAKAVAGLLVAQVRIERITCKAKLGQNRTLPDRRKVVAGLWARGTDQDIRAVDWLVRRFPELAPDTFSTAGLRFGCAVWPGEEAAITELLREAYWLKTVSSDLLRTTILASPVTVTARDVDGRLLAFARATSDRKVSWIYDVIVHPSVRRRGVGSALMRFLLDHPAIRETTVRLGTRDADGFYARLGFGEFNATAQRQKGYVPHQMIRYGASNAH